MKQVLFIFLIFSTNTFSQSIDLGDNRNILKTHFDKDKKELYVFYRDSLSIIDINSFTKISNLKTNFQESRVKLPTVSVNSKIYFIENQGGLVYRLENDEIVRIDNSFNHKMQIDATIFTYNDTIYKYGGYGLWSQRNFFNFYNTESHEWDIVPPTGSKELPKGSQESFVVINNDEFYVYGGITLNDFNPFEYRINDEIWRFNIKKKEWKKIGVTKIRLDEFIFSLEYEDKLVFLSNRNDDMYVVDVIDNNLLKYKKNRINYQHNYGSSFYSNGFIYFITLPPNSKNVKLSRFNGSDFFGELLEKKPFYNNNEKLYYVIYLFLFSVLLSLIVLITKSHLQKRKKIIVDNGSLIHNRKILNFDNKSIQILELMLSSKDDVESKNVLEIVENKELNYGHNTRVKNNLIEEINFKLKSVLGIEQDLITVKKSEIDKRIKVYTIDHTYFFIK